MVVGFRLPVDVCVCGSLLGVCWLSDAGIRNKRWLTQNEWMDCEPSECFHCYGVLAHLRNTEETLNSIKCVILFLWATRSNSKYDDQRDLPLTALTAKGLIINVLLYCCRPILPVSTLALRRLQEYFPSLDL